jgi:glucosylceramidase
MKTNKHLNGNIGGKLRTDCYSVYADYFIKYIKENEKRGSPIYAITIQNEPEYAPSYPGMLMTASEQISFINNNLGPKFRLNNITAKIVAYDHNYDNNGITYSATVLSNLITNQYIAGIGFHTYAAPNHVAMTNLHLQYPNKEFWITEAGSGTWVGSDTDQFRDQMMHLVRSARNWAKGVIFWNVALDQNSAPKLAGVDPNAVNRGLMTIRSDQMDAVKFESGYYSMGHSSKFVDPGAYRIDSNDFFDDLENVAYYNPDKTIVVVMTNRKITNKLVKVRWNGKSMRFNIAPYGSATVKFSTI